MVVAAAPAPARAAPASAKQNVREGAARQAGGRGRGDPKPAGGATGRGGRGTRAAAPQTRSPNKGP
jgi:hypothetical protein